MAIFRFNSTVPNKLALSIALTLGTPLANATLFCSGKVMELGVEAGGDISVSILNATPPHKICNINSQGTFAASTAACKAMYSTLLAAKSLGAAAQVFYYDPNLNNCGQIASYSAQSTVYYVTGPN